MKRRTSAADRYGNGARMLGRRMVWLMVPPEPQQVKAEVVHVHYHLHLAPGEAPAQALSLIPAVPQQRAVTAITGGLVTDTDGGATGVTDDKWAETQQAGGKQ